MINLLQPACIIGEQILLYIPILYGSYIAMSLMKVPNLSIESAFVTGALIGGIITKSMFFLSPFSALISGIIGAACIGGLIGIVPGLLHAYGKLSHILSTIIMIGFMYGLNILIMGGSHVPLKSEHNPLMIFGMIHNCPTLPILACIGAIVTICMFYFFKTNLGVMCGVYGDNPLFLRSHKISPTYTLCIGLGSANALAGVSGYIVAHNNNFIDVNMGMGIPLLCITALMLGRIVCSSKKPINFSVPAYGAACYFVLQACLLYAGFDLRYFPLIQATVLTTIFILQRSHNNVSIGI